MKKTLIPTIVMVCLLMVFSAMTVIPTIGMVCLLMACSAMTLTAMTPR